MPQSPSAAHFSLLETLNWHDMDDARVLRLLLRLQSSNRALEGLSRALETSDVSLRESAGRD